MGFISAIDLISGPFPLWLSVLASVGGTVLLLRRHRHWIFWVVGAAVTATLLAFAINWYVVNIAGLSAYDLPAPVILWIGVGVFALLLMVMNLVSGRWWRKLAAPMAMVLVVLAVATQINAYFGAYRTFGDLTGATTASIKPLASSVVNAHRSPALTARANGPVINRWVRPAGLTTAGTVNSVQIPGRTSGFKARTGYVYLPPAYQTPNGPPLPVVVLISGQPGSPADWLQAGRLQFVMDSFAASHHGLAPVVVIPDINGTRSGNTMCMDSRIAKADTYLGVDVPVWIKNTLNVDTNPQHWVVGGFSFGGTCALQMATLHPKVYGSAIDLSGEAEPAISSNRTATIQAAFGGNAAAFEALTPLTVMAKHHYPDSWIYFAAGANDGRFTGYMRQVSAAAKTAGMTVTTHSVPGAGHSWAVPLDALGPALTWLAPRLGLAH